MRRLAFIIFYLTICSLNTLFCQVKPNDLKITYIANEGFLLETINHKILIDALFSEGYGAFHVPDKDLNDKILKAESPFDNVSLYMLTHYHKDHCDPELINKYLSKHKTIPLVASMPSIVYIDGNCFGFIAKKEQFRVLTPKPNKTLSIRVGDIPVKAYAIKHLSMYKNDVDLEELMFNVAYQFEMDGIKIFHSGDIEMNTFKDFLSANRDKTYKVDIAFLYYNLFKAGKSDMELLIKKLQPKYIVLMHIPIKKMEEIAEKTELLKKTFPNILFFRNSMETANINLYNPN